MLQISLIGYIGAQAEVKNADGRKFTTFRVANTERWKDASGNTKEHTDWHDCVLDGEPDVVKYLKQGTLVYVQGYQRLRVYSSQKERCMKAGSSISVRQIELLGGRPDALPRQLVNPEDGSLVDVVKWYHCPALVRGKGKTSPEYIQLLNPKGGETYLADRNGFVWVQDAAGQLIQAGQQPAVASSTQQSTEQQATEQQTAQQQEDESTKAF